MGLFDGVNAAASGLTAQRLRMDVASANTANADSTRGTLVDGEWEPYRRKMVTMSSADSGFSSHLQQAMGSGKNPQVGTGTEVTGIVEDQSPFKQVYNPEHPDAGEDGYVEMPNVDPLKEMVNMMGASRSYQANITSLNASKNMMLKALEIGRGQ
ncbi:flagellar basal body rod protein FlgC [Salibacterium halotolerans]|uniref:Flagellar basal-body rod protein FlgC n=1 Tax=Salibacterium halotolerans TaxID=1884432 RepID=A0A1I5MEE2_9BACI|nr:flagellar basal body rod protein FlgC [Salibacterium halotolerans]SFP07306.1 flagellar basal-body rod protein FlgC [Salibacterium halotolerans]